MLVGSTKDARMISLLKRQREQDWDVLIYPALCADSQKYFLALGCVYTSQVI